MTRSPQSLALLGALRARYSSDDTEASGMFEIATMRRVASASVPATVRAGELAPRMLHSPSTVQPSFERDPFAPCAWLVGEAAYRAVTPRVQSF